MSLRVRWASGDACAWELGKAWAASIKVEVGCKLISAKFKGRQIFRERAPGEETLASIQSV